MALAARITEMLGIDYPIVQGEMQGVGVAKLASAVSNAGGLGILTALTQPTPEALRDEIERCRSMTSKPFAVNMTVFPTVNSPDYAAYARVVVESGAKGRELLATGDTEAGMYWASMVQGLIRDIPTVRELIDRIVSDAEAIIAERLAGMLGRHKALADHV